MQAGNKSKFVCKIFFSAVFAKRTRMWLVFCLSLPPKRPPSVCFEYDGVRGSTGECPKGALGDGSMNKLLIHDITRPVIFLALSSKQGP
uniref:Uncharacterized protein n=1 Tax=Arundo donax TaxID=35708 RepID=A0A0A9F3B3_ARUDO